MTTFTALVEVVHRRLGERNPPSARASRQRTDGKTADGRTNERRRVSTSRSSLTVRDEGARGGKLHFARAITVGAERRAALATSRRRLSSTDVRDVSNPGASHPFTLSRRQGVSYAPGERLRRPVPTTAAAIAAQLSVDQAHRPRFGHIPL